MRSACVLLVSLSAVAVAAAGTDVHVAFAGTALSHHSTWIASEAPLPANASTGNPSVSIDALECLSVHSCIAVGQYFDTGDNGQGLIETLSGTSWSATEAPLPANAGTSTNASLDAVACPSPGSCVAVGQYRDTTGDTQAFIATLSSGSWVAMEAPSPANARATFPSAHLWTLACRTALFCVATGSYIDMNGDNETAVETRADGSWTAAELPVPADASADPNIGLSRLLCLRPHSCIAMGGYNDSSGNLEGLIETLAHGVWAPTELPLPTNVASTNLLAFFYGLSCRTIHSCLAIGDYTDDNDHVQTEYEGTIDAYAHGRWTATEAPLPANSVDDGPPVSPHLHLVLSGNALLRGVGDVLRGRTGPTGSHRDPVEGKMDTDGGSASCRRVDDIREHRVGRPCVSNRAFLRGLGWVQRHQWIGDPDRDDVETHMDTDGGTPPGKRSDSVRSPATDLTVVFLEALMRRPRPICRYQRPWPRTHRDTHRERIGALAPRHESGPE